MSVRSVCLLALRAQASRCFLYCIHLLSAHVGGEQVVVDVFEGGPPTDTVVETEDGMDHRLALILWEKMAFLGFRLVQLKHFLPFLRSDRAANAVIRLTPPQPRSLTTPAPTVVDLTVDGSEDEEQQEDLSELTLSARCFEVAQRLAPHHWVLRYMRGKCAGKMGEKPQVVLEHFQQAADLCIDQWSRRTQTKLPQGERIALVPGAEEDDVDREDEKRGEEKQRKRADDGSGTEDEDEDDSAEGGDERMNVLPFYRLHSCRMKLAERIKHRIDATVNPLPHSPFASSQAWALPLGNLSGAELLDLLSSLEAHSYQPPQPSSHGSASSAVVRGAGPPSASLHGLSSGESEIVRRCDAVIANVALAMRECISRDSRFYPALNQLAVIWTRPGSSATEQKLVSALPHSGSPLRGRGGRSLTKRSLLTRVSSCVYSGG